MTQFEPEEPAVFVTEFTRSDVLDRSVLVESPRGRLALIVDRSSDSGEDNQIVAVDAWCPHIDGPLWEGSARDGEIACPWHRRRFSLATGKCVWAPQGDAEEAAETEIAVFRTQESAEGYLVILLGSPPDYTAAAPETGP